MVVVADRTGPRVRELIGTTAPDAHRVLRLIAGTVKK